MSILPLTVPPKKLAQSISSSATSFKLNNIKGWGGVDLVPADFGTEAYGVFINSTRTQIEIFKFDPATIADASIDITARGLGYTGGDVEVPANKFAWASNDTTVQLGTDAPQLFRDFLSEVNTATITAKHTYTELPESAVAPTDDEDLVNKAYVDQKTGSALAVPVTQTTHGFAVGDVIRATGTNTYAKAQANSAANAEVTGIVNEVIDANNFTYTTEGVMTVGVPAVAAGTVLFLSPSVAGALTATEPAAVGNVSVPLAIVTENAVSMVFHKYRGAVITSGIFETATTSVAQPIYQVAHGLAVGDVLKFASGSYQKAQADTAANAEVVGIVSAVADVDNFTLHTVGYIDTLSGLTADTVYFLSASTAGALTATEPTAVGNISKPVLTSTSTTAGHFLNMRGVEMTGPETVLKTYAPLPVAPLDDVHNQIGASSTSARVGLINFPVKTLANYVVFYTQTVGAAGTYDITLYSEDGQTQIFSVTTPTLAATTVYKVSLGATYTLHGNYYIMYNANSTASVAVWTYTEAQPFQGNILSANVAGSPVYGGTLTITEDTPPATFNPNSITGAVSSTLITRFEYA